MKATRVQVAAGGLTKMQKAVLDFLKKNPEDCLGLNPKQDGDKDALGLIERSGMSLSAYHWSLWSLEKKGYLVRFEIKKSSGRGRKRVYFAPKGSEGARILAEAASRDTTNPDKSYSTSTLDLERGICENEPDCADWDGWKQPK